MTVRILVVNPNTTASMTATIAAAARGVAGAGTEIVAVTSSMGPASIEGYYDEALALPGLLRGDRRRRARRRAGAPIIACFDDTGLDAARAMAAHSGHRHLRGRAGHGRLHRPALHRRDHHGALARADRGTGASLRHGRTRARARRRYSGAVARGSRIRARATGCATRSPAPSPRTVPRPSCSAAPAWPILPTTLQAEFGLPVIDGVGAAVKQAEALVALGLTTSKRGAYASPLAKPYRGVLKSFAPELSPRHDAMNRPSARCRWRRSAACSTGRRRGLEPRPRRCRRRSRPPIRRASSAPLSATTWSPAISAVAYDARFRLHRPLHLPSGHARQGPWQGGVGLPAWPVSAGRTIGLDGVPEQQANYRSKGFRPVYETIRYSGRPAALPVGAERPRMVTAQPVPDIIGYDALCFPAPRHSFLQQWLQPPHRALAAITVAGNGRLCGGAILPQRLQDRPALRRRRADRTRIARGAGERVRRRRIEHRRSGHPGGFHRGARGGGLLTDLQHHPHVQRARRRSSMPSRVFGVTTLELG